MTKYDDRAINKLIEELHDKKEIDLTDLLDGLDLADLEVKFAELEALVAQMDAKLDALLDGQKELKEDHMGVFKSIQDILDNLKPDPEDPEDPENPEEPEDPEDPEDPEEPEDPGYTIKPMTLTDNHHDASKVYVEAVSSKNSFACFITNAIHKEGIDSVEIKDEEEVPNALEQDGFYGNRPKYYGKKKGTSYKQPFKMIVKTKKKNQYEGTWDFGGTIEPEDPEEPTEPGNVSGYTLVYSGKNKTNDSNYVDKQALKVKTSKYIMEYDCTKVTYGGRVLSAGSPHGGIDFFIFDGYRLCLRLDRSRPIMFHSATVGKVENPGSASDHWLRCDKGVSKGRTNKLEIHIDNSTNKVKVFKDGQVIGAASYNKDYTARSELYFLRDKRTEKTSMGGKMNIWVYDKD